MNLLKFFLFALFLLFGAGTNLYLLSQDTLPDTLWTKKIGEGLHDVIFSPNGQYVYVKGSGFLGEYFIYKIETTTGLVDDTFVLNRPLLDHLSISPTGDTLIVSGNNYTMFWNVNTGDTLFTLKYGEEAEITPDGKRIITTNGNLGIDTPQILVTDIETKQIIKSFEGRYYFTGNPKISPDGKYFSFNDFRSTYVTVVIIDLNNFNEIKILESEAGYGNQGFSPDNKYLLTSSITGLDLWDLKTFKIQKTLQTYKDNDTKDPGGSYRLFSNDSKYLIYGYFDHEDFNPNKIIVWNIEGDSLEYEYPFAPVSKSTDISKDDYIVTGGLVNMKGFYVYLLRPKWNEVSVEENPEESLNYTFSEGILTINFNEELVVKPLMDVYDLSGKKIIDCNIINFLPGSKTIKTNINNLIPGVYLLNINYLSRNYSIKIIIP